MSVTGTEKNTVQQSPVETIMVRDGRQQRAVVLDYPRTFSGIRAANSGFDAPCPGEYNRNLLKGDGFMLAHSVFFSLNDRSDAAVQKMLAACRHYLSSHPGVVFFACGTPNSELARPVNDRDFDVALHIVFESVAAHDTYQDAPLHHQFINENKPNWKLVRVFDADIDAPKSNA
jgi:Stress responsive A/B Barrel Domain